jgi:radical SAM superfamily enzyme YgiQ (UPF0313 family)
LIDDAAEQFGQLTPSCTPDWEWVTPGSILHLEDLLLVIERAARFDSLTARLDAARFAEVYSPIGILPPDQYLALVLQATVGCSFNTCTFCDLYHQPFRVKTPDEFRRHIHDVHEYLGESLLLRQRSIFLGAANALAIPMSRLLPLLDMIQESCHSEPRSAKNLFQLKEIPRRRERLLGMTYSRCTLFSTPSPAPARARRTIGRWPSAA